MRPFIAALLGATAGLPALVHANTPQAMADPADAAAPVPVLSAPSSFADYVPYREPAASWPALDRATHATHDSTHEESMK
ncbi:hypothetical protein LFL96_23800 [Paraburkholderia sp. D15]|nr:hypothetical protein [Paraburkholderia sp. D15]WGS54064.1 hypothetical protein LFL96_23800 [Paraburkholderia sp. D15]